MLDKQKQLLFFPFVLVFYEITNYLANDMYLPALPKIVLDLHCTVHLAQQTLTTWFLGTIALTLFLGPLSDRLGRRLILFFGAEIFIVSTLFCAFASNIYILLLARFFQGCSVGTIGTAGYSSIHESYDTIKAMKILALMGSVVVLAPALGPLAGGIVLHWLSWRWVFILLSLWGSLGWLLLYWIMPETNPKANRKPLNWGMVSKNYYNIITNRKFILNTLLYCSIFFGLIAWIAAGPFLVMMKFNYSAIMFGLFQALIFSSLILGAHVVNFIVERIGPQKLINIGVAIILLGGTLILVFTHIYPHSLVFLIAGLIIISFGSALIFSPTSRLAVEASSAPMGMITAMFAMFMGLTCVLSGFLVSVTYSGTVTWFGYVLFISAIVMALIRYIDLRI